MANDVARLGAAIAERRRQLGLSQIEVWQRGGPSNSTLTRIENGLGDPPSSATLRKLDVALDWQSGSAARALDGGDPVARPQATDHLTQMAKDATNAAATPLQSLAAEVQQSLLRNMSVATTPRARSSAAGTRPTTFGDLEGLHARIEELTPERAALVSRFVDDLIVRQENDEINRATVEKVTEVPVFDATGEDVVAAMRRAENLLDTSFFDAYAPARATAESINNFASVAYLVTRRLRSLADLLADDETDRLFGSVVVQDTVTESIIDEADDIQRRVRLFVGRLIHAYQSIHDSVRRHGLDLYFRVDRRPELVPYLTGAQLDEVAEASGRRPQLRLDLPLSDASHMVAASDRGPDAKHQPNTDGEESQDPDNDDPA
ncbi:helix-turn-helix domain-containing protein [Gordonia sp. SND2]|uniref:helix-turn-helix domain-containing protein n=1 Tax=Gordonia sp. SND2 TaxID=3388659 RepID=UPI00398A7897